MGKIVYFELYSSCYQTLLDAYTRSIKKKKKKVCTRIDPRHTNVYLSNIEEKNGIKKSRLCSCVIQETIYIEEFNPSTGPIINFKKRKNEVFYSVQEACSFSCKLPGLYSLRRYSAYFCPSPSQDVYLGWLNPIWSNLCKFIIN